MIIDIPVTVVCEGCQHCPELELDTELTYLRTMDSMGEEAFHISRRCKNIGKCKSMYRSMGGEAKSQRPDPTPPKDFRTYLSQ